MEVVTHQEDSTKDPPELLTEPDIIWLAKAVVRREIFMAFNSKGMHKNFTRPAILNKAIKYDFTYVGAVWEYISMFTGYSDQFFTMNIIHKDSIPALKQEILHWTLKRKTILDSGAMLPEDLQVVKILTPYD